MTCGGKTIVNIFKNELFLISHSQLKALPSDVLALFHCVVRLGLARLDSGRFVFPLQFSAALDWVGLFTCRYSCAASTAVTS